MDTEQVLSCDWGSTAFRLRIVEIPSLTVSHEETSEEGIIKTNEKWQETGKPEKERTGFYMEIIRRHVKQLEEKSQRSLAGLPLVVCGMATSSIGMLELPYTDVPFFADGRDLVTKSITGTPDFPHDIFLISGAKTGDDVMRGEETKVAGAFIKSDGNKQVYILPGTHAKHIFFNDAKVSDFQTYMTGELFSLLSKKSILSVSVEKGGDFNNKENRESFIRGIDDSRNANCLHNFFKVRTNELFNKRSRQQNFYYLSALLIGQQLKDLEFTAETSFTLVGDENFTPLYQTALRCFHPTIDERLRVVDADQALLRGQCRIYSTLKGVKR